MAKFNRFSNWETWVVSLYLDNLEEVNDYVQRIIDRFQPYEPMQIECIQELVRDLMEARVILDVVDYDKIDWVELLTSKMKDLAFKNRKPGFMNITPLPMPTLCPN